MAHFRDHGILCDENLYFGHIHSRFQSLARNHCLKFCNQGMILFPSHLALRILGKMEREKPQAAYHRQCLLNKAISVI